MDGGKIRIRMEAYDHQALDASAKEIADHAKRTGAIGAGPIPLPTRREVYTVNRSPFLDSESRSPYVQRVALNTDSRGANPMVLGVGGKAEPLLPRN